MVRVTSRTLDYIRHVRLTYKPYFFESINSFFLSQHDLLAKTTTIHYCIILDTRLGCLLVEEFMEQFVALMLALAACVVSMSNGRQGSSDEVR